MLETNQGYEIIKAETWMEADGRSERVVLGRMETRLGTQYVTWESSTDDRGNTDYYWGHYFYDEQKAKGDYYTRLASKFE